MNLIQCWATKNACWNTGLRLQKVRGIMWHSTGANNPNLKRYVQPVPGCKDYEKLLGILGENKNRNDFCTVPYPGNRAVCPHAFIGKDAKGDIRTAQIIPWEYQGWHAGGSANSSYIGFEICEDGLKDFQYLSKVYREAVELSAFLCDLYDLDPLDDGVIICHAEGHKRGIASNHADVLHWFGRHGITMEQVRKDVKAAMSNKGLTAEDVREIVRDELVRVLQNPDPVPSKWAEKIWGQAKDKGLTDGTRPRSYATRQEVITMISAALNK